MSEWYLETMAEPHRPIEHELDAVEVVHDVSWLDHEQHLAAKGERWSARMFDLAPR